MRNFYEDIKIIIDVGLSLRKDMVGDIRFELMTPAL